MKIEIIVPNETYYAALAKAATNKIEAHTPYYNMLSNNVSESLDGESMLLSMDIPKVLYGCSFHHITMADISRYFTELSSILDFDIRQQEVKQLTVRLPLMMDHGAELYCRRLNLSFFYRTFEDEPEDGTFKGRFERLGEWYEFGGLTSTLLSTIEGIDTLQQNRNFCCLSIVVDRPEIYFSNKITIKEILKGRRLADKIDTSIQVLLGCLPTFLEMGMDETACKCRTCLLIRKETHDDEGHTIDFELAAKVTAQSAHIRTLL